MELTRRVLRPSGEDDGFIFICGQGYMRIEVTGCRLELEYTLSEREYWIYAAQFPTGRNRNAVEQDLRLTFLGQFQVRVAIRPKDADAKYGTGDVNRVAGYVEQDFRRLLQPSSR